MLLYVGAFTVHLGQLVRVGWWGWCLPPTYSRENLFFVMLALCAAELWARQCTGLEVSKRAGLPPNSANACEGEPLPDRSALVISALGSREEAKQGRQVLGNWPHWKYPKGCPEASEWGTIFRIRQETVTLVLIFTNLFFFFFSSLSSLCFPASSLGGILLPFALQGLLTHTSIYSSTAAMETGSPRKIQFTVPLLDTHLDPEAAEQVTPERGTQIVGEKKLTFFV